MYILATWYGPTGRVSKTVYADMQNFEFGVDINCKLSFTCDFRGCYSSMLYAVINTLIIHVLLAGTSEW